MSKRYNIKWTQADEQELKKAVKNFNAKIDYHAKKDPKNKSALPEKITVKAYRDGSSLLSSDGEKTGEYSFINGYSSAPAEDRELYAAYVAFGISLKAYLADGE
jgi:hypothetical protein